jgi:hypothetical protein
VKLASASLEANPGIQKLRLGKLLPSLGHRTAAFKTAVSGAASGASSSEKNAIFEGLGGLDQLLKTISSGTPALAESRQTAEIVNDVRKRVASALSTDVIADPAAAARLPFRFTVPTVEFAGRPIEELKGAVDAGARSVNGALQDLLTSLKNPRSAPDTNLAAVAKFHGALDNGVI